MEACYRKIDLLYIWENVYEIQQPQFKYIQ